MEDKFKELDFLDEKISNINMEMLSLEKGKNEIEETKAKLSNEITELEDEKKEILTKTDKYKGIRKYLYMIIQANSDLKNLKIINTKLEENRIKLQEVENKLDIKNKLIKEKLQDKLDVWNRREEIYITRNKEQEKQTENTEDYKLEVIKEIDQEKQESKAKVNTKGEQERDLKRLITLFELVNAIDFENKQTIKIKNELVQGLNQNIEKYLKENNIKPPQHKRSKNLKMEVENEC